MQSDFEKYIDVTRIDGGHQNVVTDRLGYFLFTSKQYQTGHVPKCPQLWTGYQYAISDVAIRLTVQWTASIISPESGLQIALTPTEMVRTKLHPSL